jgi:hypothetical protein
MRVEWDVAIEMDDRVVLRADVFRPDDDARYPVIVSCGPYAKDRPPAGTPTWRASGSAPRLIAWSGVFGAVRYQEPVPSPPLRTPHRSLRRCRMGLVDGGGGI